ncbi:MAG: tRNA (adenosine(37)-N6)-threonylcarbamoyltransferase complex dimerization subunit type 1 TsaB [Lachnospiraceae bacterium]|nr:tRNA (adenosine(37)-N6)-threonylcarbamoyltransferase complex dimerization subunit type 1 TsaB [Lachnospiraceae bacterium]MDO4734276.1 tRNA (adenosine(37)-N6)-threonylcarbamoyltransferase complex dimerization subunit type 1 TsaB [Lachnospiraceae bacterium]
MSIRILGIETSGPLASVALLKDGEVQGMKVGEFKVTHSETLMPMIDELVKETGMKLESLDAIAVSAGPGSFTGLRIGSATAKGLGMALNKPLIHIPTLHGMAYNLLGHSGFIVPMIDARRGTVYTGIFTFVLRADNTIDFEVFQDTCVMSIEELMERLELLTSLDGNPPPVVFLGDGLFEYHEKIDQLATFDYQYAPDEAMIQRADTVALLGQLFFYHGMTVPADQEAPDYLQKSQAERVKEEKEQK